MTNARTYANYPPAQAHEIPYRAPPAPQNPVVKGALLHYLANIVAAVPGLPSLLWSNAGFTSLRKLKEIEKIDPRYDPTVTPIPKSGDKAPTSHTHVTKLRAPPSNADGRFYSIADFHDAYKNGRLTPVDVVEAILPLIRRDVENRSSHSTAFVNSRVDLVMQAAEASTKRWKEGNPLGILDGVPFGVKDDVNVKGYGRYIGTKRDYNEGKEVETSWCVRKVEEEGAVLVGKLNMHELGMDTTNNNPWWGTPLNPYNPNYYCGGSSGGPAYAVSSGLIPFAIGSDGGGSIRIPSNYCGLYGLKPSHGRVSIAPLHNAGKSVTVYGPISNNMGDLEVFFRVLAQPDPSQHASSQFAPPKPVSTPRNKTIGICKGWFDRADPIVQEKCQDALRYFTSELGYEIVDITLPFLYEGQMAHAMTILAEGATSTKNISNLTPANKILMRVAQQTPATDFLLAQKLRHVFMQHLAHLFAQHPGLVIVTPTTPNAGWPIGDGELAYGMTDGNTQVRNMEYVWLANFTGVPCIQFPVGFVEGKAKGERKGKVPVGMMGHGDWGCEDALVEFGFDGERWLHEGCEGGRLRPEGWVDVLEKRV
ncbi:glutamyl-tRNA amidotransferas-like protein subunit A [Lentithecium fluviatile CBS 122367]|uniref:Glutamyl-tRNA amidotransferas-like protein subunit A n=1 Tax=Lentithecium fluviatile CBS 122367 TaxID=1168545 RepID=A0A6G1IHF4_9PLEO|nr:glutamyl-tRNA amidotransferas-like protein subunit A [Lentithecium fluviatile CBS 122367]